MTDDETWVEPDRPDRWFGHRDRHEEDHVAFLQSELVRIGITPTDPPGRYGPGTEAAVRMFQMEAGLPSTGVCDQLLWLNLCGWPDA